MGIMKAITTVAITTLISSAAMAANLGVQCFKGFNPKSNAAVLLSFEIANTSSGRLVSDIQESRSSSDSETLPSFLVSQYKFQPIELLVEVDDASPEGNVLAKLQAIYASKKSGEKARYVGAYKRLDAGRELSTIVTCVVKEL